MKLTGKQILGLAVDARQIIVCQARIDSPDALKSVTTAAFPLPEGATFDDVATFAEPFADFLKEHGFTARHAVVGLPAAWVAVKERAVPPAEAHQTLEMVRLLAEREFSTDQRELVFDAALHQSAAAASSTPSDAADLRPVLLLAAMHKRIETVRSLAEHLHIKLHAITCSPVTLAQALHEDPSPILLHITPHAVEMIYRHGGQFQTLRHLGTSGPGDNGGDAAWANTLGGELRRLAMNLPAANDLDLAVSLNDAAGLAAPTVDALAERLGRPPRFIHDLKTRRQSTTTAPPQGAAAHNQAVSLVLAASSEQPLLVDFLYSKLTPPARRLPRLWKWAAASAAIILLAATMLIGDMVMTSRDLTAMQREHQQIHAQADQAAALRDQIRLARNWFDNRPRVRDWMLALTHAFPERGTIWASSITLEDDMTATLSGQAESERTVLTVLDAIEASPQLAQPQLIRIREADRQSRNMAFTIHFRYLPQAARPVQTAGEEDIAITPEQ